jgi:hypothetical protein
MAKSVQSHNIPLWPGLTGSMLVGYKIFNANGRQVSIIGAQGDAKGDAAVSIMGWEFYSG